MLKKFFVVALFVTLTIFISIEKVDAKDIWIANKGENVHYYVMAETFKKTIGENFSVVVKTVYNQGATTTNRTWTANTYEFELSPTNEWQFKKEDPGAWIPVKHDVVANKVCDFFVKYFN